MRVNKKKEIKEMKKRLLTAVFAGIMAAVVSAFGLTACSGAANGGKGFDDSKKISVVVREDGSGTKSAFMEIIGLKGKADKKGVIVGSSTAAVMVEVENNPYAIAYDSLGYVTEDVKKLKVEGVEPTIANIKDGSYKISRQLNIVYKAATVESGLNKAYYEFLQSSDAQEIISANGYVSVKDGATKYTVQSGLTGEINISGSTSLEPLMVELAKKFMTMQSGVKVVVGGGGSGTGYKNAENGVSDFGMISETFNSEKAPFCESYTVAKDGIAVIVNKNNTTEDISLETLKNIYDLDSEEVTTWAQVK